MRAETTTFIKVYNSTFFIIRFFRVMYLIKKTPLKHRIFNFFATSSNSKLFNDLLGNITLFLTEIMFLIRKYLLYLYYQPKN